MHSLDLITSVGNLDERCIPFSEKKWEEYNVPACGFVNTYIRDVLMADPKNYTSKQKSPFLPETKKYYAVNMPKSAKTPLNSFVRFSNQLMPKTFDVLLYLITVIWLEDGCLPAKSLYEWYTLVMFYLAGTKGPENWLPVSVERFHADTGIQQTRVKGLSRSLHHSIRQDVFLSISNFFNYPFQVRLTNFLAHYAAVHQPRNKPLTYFERNKLAKQALIFYNSKALGSKSKLSKEPILPGVFKNLNISDFLPSNYSGPKVDFVAGCQKLYISPYFEADFKINEWLAKNKINQHQQLPCINNCLPKAVTVTTDVLCETMRVFVGANFPSRGTKQFPTVETMTHVWGLLFKQPVSNPIYQAHTTNKTDGFTFYQVLRTDEGKKGLD